MKKPTMKANQCPRCGRGIPNDMERGKYPGALSRLDNQTEVCSACGQIEAMLQFGKQPVTPRSGWYENTGVAP